MRFGQFLSWGDLSQTSGNDGITTVKQDTYVVGALTDHLVPWQSAYAATQALGGHVRALINPPDNPKASFSINPDNPADPPFGRFEGPPEDRGGSG